MANIDDLLEKAIKITQINFNKKNFTREEFKKNLITNFNILYSDQNNIKNDNIIKKKITGEYYSPHNGIYLCQYDINHKQYDIYININQINNLMPWLFPLGNGLFNIKTHDYRGFDNCQYLKKSINRLVAIDMYFKNGWYIPSKVELDLLYELKKRLEPIYPWLYEHTYWSSSIPYTSACHVFQVWAQDMKTGKQKLYRMDSQLRCIPFKAVLSKI